MLYCPVFRPVHMCILHMLPPFRQDVASAASLPSMYRERFPSGLVGTAVTSLA
jgi:hypothetical protein